MDSMNPVKKNLTTTLCICYRLLALALSTIAFITMSISGGGNLYLHLVICVGMILACLLGIVLYRSVTDVEEASVLTVLIFITELVAYGIFLFLSGGIASPYLWYCISCIFIMVLSPKTNYYILPVIGWYFLCIATERLVWPHKLLFTQAEANLLIGLIIVTGGFYLILYYFKQLDEMQKILEQHMIQDEKNRIADEIHDTVIQKLFGIACSLAVLNQRHSDMTDGEVSDELLALRKSTELAMQDLCEAVSKTNFEKR